MPEELEQDDHAEAYELVRALRAHVELLSISGACGVPRAETPIGPSLSEPPPSMAPAAMPKPAVPSAAVSPVAVQPAQPAAIPDWLASATQKSPAPARAAAPARVASTEAAAPASLPLATLSIEERRERLALLENSIRGCQNCGLAATRTQTVFSRGTGSSGLCFVGEGPGADEDIQGFPFVGAAGQLLDKMIAAMGLQRDEVYVCNIVKCRPPENRKPDPSEMQTCLPYLAQQLDLLAPEVIVALGATAVEGLLGAGFGGITRLRGNWKLYKGRIAVMPTFHPAYLLRAPSAKHVVWEDMQAVLRHLGRPVPERGKKSR